MNQTVTKSYIFYEIESILSYLKAGYYTTYWKAYDKLKELQIQAKEIGIDLTIPSIKELELAQDIDYLDKESVL